MSIYLPTFFHYKHLFLSVYFLGYFVVLILVVLQKKEKHLKCFVEITNQFGFFFFFVIVAYWTHKLRCDLIVIFSGYSNGLYILI